MIYGYAIERYSIKISCSDVLSSAPLPTISRTFIPHPAALFEARSTRSIVCQAVQRSSRSVFPSIDVSISVFTYIVGATSPVDPTQAEMKTPRSSMRMAIVNFVLRNGTCIAYQEPVPIDPFNYLDIVQ